MSVPLFGIDSTSNSPSTISRRSLIPTRPKWFDCINCPSFSGTAKPMPSSFTRTLMRSGIIPMVTSIRVACACFAALCNISCVHRKMLMRTSSLTETERSPSISRKIGILYLCSTEDKRERMLGAKPKSIVGGRKSRQIARVSLIARATSLCKYSNCAARTLSEAALPLIVAWVDARLYLMPISS